MDHITLHDYRCFRDLSILYFERNELDVTIHNLEVDADGGHGGLLGGGVDAGGDRFQSRIRCSSDERNLEVPRFECEVLSPSITVPGQGGVRTFHT